MVSSKTLHKHLRAAASEVISNLDAPPADLDAGIDALAKAALLRVPGSDLEQARRAVRKAIRQKFGLERPAGGKPNTSVALSDGEIAFIEEAYGGSRSEAIHAALALLMKQRGRKAKA